MTEHVSSVIEYHLDKQGTGLSKWNAAIFNVIYYICAFPVHSNQNSVAVGMAI